MLITTRRLDQPRSQDIAAAAITFGHLFTARELELSGAQQVLDDYFSKANIHRPLVITGDIMIPSSIRHEVNDIQASIAYSLY